MSFDLKVARKTDPGFAQLAARIKGAKNLKAGSVKVGFLSKAGSELIIAAATNEYGTDSAGVNHNVRIPPRPTLKPILRDKQLVEFVREQGRRVLLKGMSPRMALERIGLKAKSLVQRNIRSNTPPPNAPSTVRAKGSTRTLIDTGRELQSVSYEVDGAE
jgi:hypothetical protein